ncbi:hypothetical protein [Rhizobium sp. OAE497]|uniref:hypothetical protein n=1 Tax=Rhizobium sp. OAE497 TaxID=2663796 RepID=UPI0018F75983
MKDIEVPVFDRRHSLPDLIDQDLEWAPARTLIKGGGVKVTLPNDGPSPDHRIRAGVAWYSSHPYSGQADNDNKDWPLEKLLRTEGNDHCLALAERYRDLHDASTRPTQLIGRETDNLYLVQNEDGEGKSKGTKVVTGKKAVVDTPPRRASLLTSDSKKRAAAVPKKWTGDWPILSAIDAKRELAILRAQLAFVPKILDAFEWSVVNSLTLDEIGKRLGAGSKGGKGEARARIFDGFTIVDRFWQRKLRTARKREEATYASSWWQPGMPVPSGYYQSRVHPDMIFPAAA